MTSEAELKRLTNSIIACKHIIKKNKKKIKALRGDVIPRIYITATSNNIDLDCSTKDSFMIRALLDLTVKSVQIQEIDHLEIKITKIEENK